MEEHDALSEVEQARIGLSFDDFLDEEGIREEVGAQTLKEVLAWPIEQAMNEAASSGAVRAEGSLIECQCRFQPDGEHPLTSRWWYRELRDHTGRMAPDGLGELAWGR